MGTISGIFKNYLFLVQTFFSFAGELFVFNLFSQKITRLCSTNNLGISKFYYF